MRSDINRSTYTVVDIGDQPKGKYLLKFITPPVDATGGFYTNLWVDKLEVIDGQVVGFSRVAGKEYEVVVVFSPLCPYFLLAAERVEVMTKAEAYDWHRKQMASQAAQEKLFAEEAQKLQEQQALERDDVSKAPNWDDFLKGLTGEGE